jgi:DNA polymerase I-like protein with 3'-5' exonuclease and polymerase domains
LCGGSARLRATLILNLFCPYFIFEARDGIEDQVQTIVEESMEEAFKRIIPEVPFVAEIRVADSWKS